MGDVKKPTRFQHQILKITCGDCSSRFMLKIERDLKIKDRRVFITKCFILDISDGLKQIISSDPIVKAKVWAERKGLIDSKPDNSVIETEMD